MANISLFDDEFLGGDFPKPTINKTKTKSVIQQDLLLSSHGLVIDATDANAVWQICLDALRLEMSEIEFNQWLKPLKPQIIDGQLVLFAINTVFIRHINTNYLEMINQILVHHQTGLSAKVQVHSPPKNNKKNIQKQAALAPKVGTRIDESDTIDAYCTFENFIKSKSNMLAYNACYELAKRAGQEVATGSHLLFIYGLSGLGKTHLMQAVAHRYQKAGLSYCYFTKDHFFQIAIQAMRGTDGGANHLVKRIAKADLLMIDDVHMINAKNGPKVSQFLMTLFECFTKDNKRLILASNRPPAQMQDFDERFLSRFSGGLTLAIEPPEIETRVQILQKKATSLQLHLPKECAVFIARNAPPDVRSLEGALNQVRANAMLTDGEINLDLVRYAIKDHVEARAKAINAESIRDVVAEYYGVSIKDLLGKKRLRSIARPRQMAMALVRELTCDSFPEIGQAFGGRDHTTVMHACETVAKLRLSEPNLDKDYQTLMATLRFT